MATDPVIPPPPAGFQLDNATGSQTNNGSQSAIPPPPPGFTLTPPDTNSNPNGSPDDSGGISSVVSGLGRAASSFADTSGLSGIGSAIKSAAQHPLDTLSMFAGEPTDAAKANIQNIIKSQYDHTKDELAKSYQAAKSGNIISRTGDSAVSHLGSALPIAGPLLDTLTSTHDDPYAQAGAVAGIVTALMAPDLLRGAKGYAADATQSLSDQLDAFKRGNSTSAAEAAQRQGVEITPGRARSGIPHTAEQLLRSNSTSAEPFMQADEAARQSIQERGADIADQIFKTDKSVDEQGQQLQDTLKQTRKVAGENVGAVHSNIANLAPDATLDTTGDLQRVAQQQINNLQIDPDSAYAGEETPNRTRVINELQKYANPTQSITTPASTILDSTGAPMQPEITQEVPKVLPFADANKLLQTLNDLIPDSTTAEGGALKQVAKALRGEMYNSLEPYKLADQLKNAHQRFATVVDNLENGVGKRVLGSRLNPTPPEQVANYLARPNGGTSLNMTSLRTLLGPERLAPVGRLVVQHIIEGSPDGASLTKNFNALPDAVKNGLLTPEQLDTLKGYVRDVRQMNIPAEPTKLPAAFSNTSSAPVATHSATGLIINVAKNVAMRMGAKTLARMVLEPESSQILRKAIVTLKGSRGANPLTQRLMYAAMQSGLRDDQDSK